MEIKDISYGRGLKRLGYVALLAGTLAACADFRLINPETPNISGRPAEQVSVARSYCLSELEGEYKEKLRSIQDHYRTREKAAAAVTILFPAAIPIAHKKASRQVESLNLAFKNDVNGCINDYLEDD